VFGRVIKGMDVVDNLQKTERSPAKPDRIIEARVLSKRNHPYEPKKIPE
jgi:cyclophilin family peptidyl-prolyl cis-trans isomerase